ncbi:hypothetical protein [Kitasatospora phosalacinea]|uniref:Uncharacterized protein n=1 Tax=Kitasatospora phosalacinea TaxID=2065 RepID=A0ABW6GRH6_9ACTN
MDDLSVTAPAHQIERIFDMVVAPLKGTAVTEGSLTPREEIIAAYEWAPGRCYRCGTKVDRTAVVGRLVQPTAKIPVRACENCTVRLERSRELAAERYGWPYSPGAL